MLLSVGGLFDGAGLLALGLHQAGLRHAWLCEFDPWRRELLERRFGVPVFDDVRAVGGSTAVRVDVIAGGFPCKGASTAGKRNGFDHPETVLWREMARAVRELRPRYVVVENVAAILSLHDGAVWAEVLGDLAASGYRVEWDVLPAAAVGAPHLRERVFAIASHAGDVERRPDQGERGLHDGSLGVPGRRGEGPDQHAAGDHRPAPDAGGERRQQVARGAHGDEGADARRGADADHELAGAREGWVPAAVEWGEYEPAIRRWEAVHGPAPEPLIRRLDDGDRDLQRLRTRVDRSRLSALGDGVHVYLGRLIGSSNSKPTGLSTAKEPQHDA